MQGDGEALTQPVRTGSQRFCELQGGRRAGLSDLAGQDQFPIPLPTVLAGKDRHKSIVRVKTPRSLITDKDLNTARVGEPVRHLPSPGVAAEVDARRELHP